MNTVARIYPKTKVYTGAVALEDEELLVDSRRLLMGVNLWLSGDAPAADILTIERKPADADAAVSFPLLTQDMEGESSHVANITPTNGLFINKGDTLLINFPNGDELDYHLELVFRELS